MTETEGSMRRDEGIDRVGRSVPDAWICAVTAVIRLVAQQRDEFTQARVRWECDRLRIPKPHHPNAWGAVFRRALRAGIIEKTGRTVKSGYPASTHARSVPVYRRKVS